MSLLDLAEGISTINDSAPTDISTTQQSNPLLGVDIKSMYHAGYVDRDKLSSSYEETDSYISKDWLKILKEPEFEIGDVIRVSGDNKLDIEYAICIGKCVVSSCVGPVFRTMYIPIKVGTRTENIIYELETQLNENIQTIASLYADIGVDYIGDLEFVVHLHLPINFFKIIRDASFSTCVFNIFARGLIERVDKDYSPPASLISVVLSKGFPVEWKTGEYTTIKGVETLDWVRRYTDGRSCKAGKIYSVKPSEEDNGVRKVFCAGQYIYLFNGKPWIDTLYLPFQTDNLENIWQIYNEGLKYLKNNRDKMLAGAFLGKGVRLTPTSKSIFVHPEFTKELWRQSTPEMLFGGYADYLIASEEKRKKIFTR